MSRPHFYPGAILHAMSCSRPMRADRRVGTDLPSQVEGTVNWVVIGRSAEGRPMEAVTLGSGAEEGERRG